MTLSPGDCGWANQKGFINRAIRFCQGRKYGSSPAAQWNHVYMVVGWNGELIQATGGGMNRGNVSDYAGQDVAYRRPKYYGQNALEATHAMQELLNSHTSYGFVTIASIALNLLTGTRLRFGLAGTEICSGAVAYALTRANINLGPDELFDTPADLMWTAITQNWENVA